MITETQNDVMVGFSDFLAQDFWTLTFLYV